jgi:hypothetical protein
MKQLINPIRVLNLPAMILHQPSKAASKPNALKLHKATTIYLKSWVRDFYLRLPGMGGYDVSTSWGKRHTASLSNLRYSE